MTNRLLSRSERYTLFSEVVAMKAYAERLAVGIASGLVALVGVLLARGAWAAQETIHWQDILWWVSLVALFRLGYAIACASEDDDPEREQGIVVVALRMPASLAGLLLVIIPLGAAHLVMSFQGTPLEPLALVRLAVLGIAVWLAGLLWGAPKRLPPASLARHIVRCVTKTRVHIALQRSLP
jgi:4-hydroxybenzoate polyprenyltransferase